MRYACSNEKKYKRGVGDVPVWKDASFDFSVYDWINNKITSHIKNFDNEREFIKAYYNRKLQPSDFDNCGWETVYFVFSTGKAFKLDHYWGHNLDHDPEDDYSSWASYDMEMGECPFDEVPEFLKIKDRDWLI